MRDREVDRKIAEKIGQNVRAARIAAGLTLKQFADLAGVSIRTLCNIEAGSRQASATSIFRIAKELKIPVGDLFPKRIPRR